MAKKQFKSESKRILDLMINSIYTHKEIFLRELVSNASDAIDKMCYISLTDDKVGLSREDFRIIITPDTEKRTITISDNGLGMTAADLENNLGVIAKSGSLQFKNEMENKGEEFGDIDIIGQFGVGFYSAFMVAQNVTVISKAYGDDGAARWISSGTDGYTITACEKETVGTDIIIELKPDSEEESFSDFLNDYTLRSLIKKYSDYIRWPIVLGGETINSMIPVWQRSKSEVSNEDCIKFYKEKFFETKDPVSVIRVNAEGAVSYTALLFIPASIPYNYYTATFEPGLQLYSSGVMIMEKCAALLPECFRFVQGIVDSQDLSLNISRELLQHDKQLKVIASNLEKKIKSELKKLMDNEPEKYEAFYRNFGLQLKYGIVSDYGIKKELLSDLIMFWSAKQEKLISLTDYVKNMPEAQKNIYFACAENVAIAAGLPQAEPVKEKGFDILYLTDNVDEFVVRMIGSFMEKEFKSVNDNDLGLENDDEKRENDKFETENREFLDFVKDSLDGSIAAAKISHKLKSFPVCLSTQGAVSLEMERYFASVPTSEGGGIKAERVLELNANHPVFSAVKDAFCTDREKAKKYCRLLYSQALIIAGYLPEDPSEFASLMSELII